MLYTLKTRVEQIIPLTHDVVSIKFKLIEPSIFSFIAGQYVLLDADGISRQYSIANIDTQKDLIELIIQIIPGGRASLYISKLTVGKEVNLKGPMGVFTLKQTDKPKICIATGTGVVPLKSMIASYIERKDNMSVLFYLTWGIKTYKDLHLLDYFKELEVKYPNFSFSIAVSREDLLKDPQDKHITLGRVTNVIPQYIKQHNLHYSACEFYLCGRQAIVESLRLFLLDQSAQKDMIYFEKFA